MVAIPGVAPVVAAGWLVAALAGATAGAVEALPAFAAKAHSSPLELKRITQRRSHYPTYGRIER